MSIIVWVAAKAVDYAMADIRLSSTRPDGHDDALAWINDCYADTGEQLDFHMRLLNKTTFRFESSSLLAEIARISRIGSITNLIANISDVSAAMSRIYYQSLQTVSDSLGNRDRKVYREFTRGVINVNDLLIQAFDAQWQLVIRELVRRSQEANTYETDVCTPLAEGVLIKHITSIAQANSIVTDAFKVAADHARNDHVNRGDHCANFYSAVNLTSQSQSTGCIMLFRWSGPVVYAPDLAPEQMQPSILYDQGEWRQALRPETTGGLEFIDATFQAHVEPDDAPLIMNILNRRGAPAAVRWR